jgi:hypothetical protein
MYTVYEAVTTHNYAVHSTYEVKTIHGILILYVYNKLSVNYYAKHVVLPKYNG